MGLELDPIDALARRYEHRVGFFVQKVSRSLQLGTCWHDDLTSAGYWGLFKALQNLRESASERERSAYVSQKVVGAVLDEARSRLSSTRQLCHAPAEEHEQDWLRFEDSRPSTPEEATDLRRRDGRIARALEVLAPDQQRFLRSYMAGASVREIAAVEGIPLGTMRARFERLGRDLRGRSPELRRILLDLEEVKTF